MSKLYNTKFKPTKLGLIKAVGQKIGSLIKGKGKKSPTIKSVKPAVGSLTKRRKDTDEIFGIRKKAGLPPSRDAAKTVKKVSSINDNIDAINKKRKGRMGGGFMGKRMGYSQGSSKGKIPTTPKEKSLAKLAPPKDRITFGDVVAGRTKGKA
tara:strand:- start:26 stop:481 length:456 start_codon:yes stop_codon:yes gene_type:complete